MLMSQTAVTSERPLAPLPEPDYRVRFITAASLFDGHDASINVMRRILQSSGVEVIHLGHNRSVQEIVDAAVEEVNLTISATEIDSSIALANNFNITQSNC